MAKKRVYICFDYDNDKTLKDFLVGQSKYSDSPFEVEDWSMKEAAKEKEWEIEAEKRIKRSEQVIVITGTQTYRAPGVKKEVKITRDLGKPIFQIKGYKDRNCPRVENAGEYYKWTWDNLKTLLK
ncbi:MAG: TIR domain-containing protein [Acidobacteria bacterium]|nr:TIR domain-containing protein [Acidobacteriota bacterium]